MFSKCQILSRALLSLSVMGSISATGCGGANKTTVSTDKPKRPTIEKGTETVSTFEGNSSLLKLIFEELSWSVRSADIAVNKIGQDELREGCITYTRPARGNTFALARFNCSQRLAIGEAEFTHRRTLIGSETYTEPSSRSAFITMRSSFEQNLYQLKGTKLVGKGSYSRGLQIARPQSGDAIDATLTAFGLDSKTNYIGVAAAGSDRVGERFEMTVKGVFDSSRFAGMKLPRGLTLSMLYSPEKEKTAQTTVRYTLTATNDITYSTDGRCLRPIGSFTWSRKGDGKTVNGTLSTTSVGISVSGEPETIPWGNLCLEQ